MWTVTYCVLGFLVVLFVTGNLIERSRGVRFRPGWLCMVVGLRGGGKSLFVARLVARRLAQGVNVVGNVSYEGCKRMTSWEDVILAPAGSLVVLDEAHQWAKAQAGKSPDPMADWYISHCGKLMHEVFVLSQHESQVASFVRNQLSECIEVEEWLAGIHRARSYAPHMFRKAKAKPLWTWWYSPRGAATKVYDTFELVEPVISERDSDHVVAQKSALRGLILEIRARNLAAGVDRSGGRRRAAKAIRRAGQVNVTQESDSIDEMALAE